MNLSAVKIRIEQALGRLGYASCVLMYHRVAVEEYDPWGLCVSPEHFAQQLELLKQRAECVPLEYLVDQRRSYQGRRPCISVTFDDGYVDNVRAALPLLERFDIPATIFVVSSKLGSRREFWWDALERCILRPPVLPTQLDLVVGGAKHSWDIPAEDASRLKPWRADTDVAASSRQILFLELWELLAPRTSREQEACLDYLMAWAAVATESVETRLPMSLEDLEALRSHPLIEIGGHTLSHSLLPELSASEQRTEVGDAQAHLGRILGRPVRAFSYPYGRYSRLTREVARARSSLACTSRHAPVAAIARRWEIPRLQVPDARGRDFAPWLRRHLPRMAP